MGQVMFVNRALAFMTASMSIRGDKLGGGHVARPAGVLGIVSEALFLRRSKARPTLLGQSKRLPRTGTVRKKRTSGVHGLT
jgi:hypothetical protein